MLGFLKPLMARKGRVSVTNVFLIKKNYVVLFVQNGEIEK